MGNKEPLCTQHPHAELSERVEWDYKTYLEPQNVLYLLKKPESKFWDLIPSHIARMSAFRCVGVRRNRQSWSEDGGSAFTQQSYQGGVRGKGGLHN